MNKIMKKAMAAAFALTIVGGIPAAFGKTGVFMQMPVIEANADSVGSAVLNEETGVLTLSGRVTAEQIWANVDKIERIVCVKGTVLPADSSSLFRSQQIGYVCEIDLSNADTSEVTDISNMFSACYSLISLDLSSFNTAKVSNMSKMFSIVKNLEKVYVSDGWSTNAAVSSDRMFWYSSKLIGDKGTKYSIAHINAEYARPDSGSDAPGYFRYVSPSLNADKAKVNGASITLGGKIGVNFYTDVPSIVKKAVLDGPNGKVVLNAAAIAGGRQFDGDFINTFKLSYDINSDQANEKVRVSFYGDDDSKPIDIYNSNNEKVSDGYIEYSVNDYIAEVSANPSANEKLNALVSALDNYCKASENYFDNKSNTVNGIDNISSFGDLNLTTSAPEMEIITFDNKDVITTSQTPQDLELPPK